MVVVVVVVVVVLGEVARQSIERLSWYLTRLNSWVRPLCPAHSGHELLRRPRFAELMCVGAFGALTEYGRSKRSVLN